MSTKKFPDFVTFSDGLFTLRHVGAGRYYRDAGMWGVNSMWKGNRLVCSDRKGKLAHVFGNELIPCSMRKWKRDNVGYLPKEYQ